MQKSTKGDTEGDHDHHLQPDADIAFEKIDPILVILGTEINVTQSDTNVLPGIFTADNDFQLSIGGILFEQVVIGGTNFNSIGGNQTARLIPPNANGLNLVFARFKYQRIRNKLVARLFWIVGNTFELNTCANPTINKTFVSPENTQRQFKRNDFGVIIESGFGNVDEIKLSFRK